MRHILIAIAALVFAAPAFANSRIKDMVDVEDVRDNHLVGYGLVVGLDGTGDSLRNASFTNQSLNAMLEQFNVNTRDANLNTRNVAAVMVTASLPAFSSQGSRIDVTVSAIGDASSLQGGTLVATPLFDSLGRAWAVSQGTLTVGGFQAQGDGASITRGVPTSGRIANGALVENPFAGSGIDPWAEIANRTALRLSLRNPDFTTARRMADAINAYIGGNTARAIDPGTVELRRPTSFGGDMIDLLAEVEQLRVEADLPARVIIDENTGTIVMGQNVRVSTVAIAQGNLTITITETPIASQPNPFGNGETEVLERTDIQVTEDNMQLGILEGSVSLAELVDGLNALGVTPRDLITILQAIKAAGALQADIEVL
ncbi:flagellar basal body P-ring protein FlgI [Maricaulis sp.]|uniref:flagellar basal body P-ring protein FlgI n=1 Tax=Maricaulis sp. TaxID=1486257 RepID=UPI00260EB1FD|nr:flagellar basal body P-ring protein FlgI [Maricaulis sp.]